jgi:periplasmic glucans biosynthesis protein
MAHTTSLRRVQRNLCTRLGLTLLACSLILLPGLLLAAESKEGFGLQNVINKAQDLAKKPFQERQTPVPDFLTKMKYDDWRDIRFDPEQSIWLKEKLPFTLQFFHPGLYYTKAVSINTVDGAGVQPVPFSTDLFKYGKDDIRDRVHPNLGFAGFRIHFPINVDAYRDEVAVFLGASYFRAVAKNQNYGLSARGLAIDTGLPSGEEFPSFTDFWIVKPEVGAKKIMVYALLDSISITGAYRFVITPGKETVIDVTSRLFPRKTVDKIGIAPLTSMFFYGENVSQRPIDDFRPEIHDSDGLSIATRSGEWIWRPLYNPRTLLMTSFHAPDPVGFGLIQRDLEFDHYQDLEARYEARPSIWISPVGKWGNGRVELIQIPTDKEINDNIIAFWVPDRLPEKGQPIWFSYRMLWHYPGPGRPPAGRVVATRIAKGRSDKAKVFMIDFAGERLESLPADKPLTAVINVEPRARLIEQQLYKNSVTGGWRLVFQIGFEDPSSLEKVLPAIRRPVVELRAFLKLGDNALTETWSYAYQP